jgi:hypothetical protein
MAKKPAPTIEQLTAQANNYAKSVLSTVPFPSIHTLSEEQFGKALSDIMQALVSAWAAGYLEGTKRK